MTKPPVSNPELKPKFFWFHLKPEQINWVLDDAVSKPRGVVLLICMLLCLAQVNLEVEMLKRQAMASLCLGF